MEYEVLLQVVTNNRISDIFLIEKNEKLRKTPLLKATQKNDQVDAELSNPFYRKMQRSPEIYQLRAKENIARLEL